MSVLRRFLCSPWSLEADDLGVHPVGLCLFQIGGDFVLFVVIEVDLCDCYAAVQIFRGFGGSCLLQIVAHSLLRLTLTPPPPPTDEVVWLRCVARG